MMAALEMFVPITYCPSLGRGAMQISCSQKSTKLLYLLVTSYFASLCIRLYPTLIPIYLLQGVKLANQVHSTRQFATFYGIPNHHFFSHSGRYDTPSQCICNIYVRNK